ncbi:dTMP kinase [Fructilactobacillus cliffordii]|uniref:Thymidylate kinase n=1 Tax=Fructilactobacillus cliffordii TaxID=2940299 RepID=A0A9Q8ZW80_9LACO|nr:dTMP kinase [Fructilactobacillus cliffordii]USS86987.1 dTMP kinase [Fructilactobacillus cliffordii]USS88711.1 dTMP kinase [Fructilactobacillus cliffordii]
MSGHFITFEGNDGAGKTTVLNQVVDRLQPQLWDQLVVTREPGGDPIAEKIRNLIVDEQNEAMDARTEALLFAAARRQHLEQKVLPALAQERVVLCDRYVDSSVAYQGAGRQLGEQKVLELNQFATNGVLPELTIYFAVPVAVGLERIEHRDEHSTNRLDREQRDFYVRVHDAYERLAQAHPERIVRVDATQSVTTVTNQVLAIIMQHLK